MANCDCCRPRCLVYRFVPQSYSLSEQKPWCGFWPNGATPAGGHKIKYQDKIFVTYGESDSSSYLALDDDAGSCTNVASSHHESIALQTFEIDASGACSFRDHGTISCIGHSVVESWSILGKGEDATHAHGRTEWNPCITPSNVNYCNRDGEILAEPCICTPSVRWEYTYVPKPVDTATERYINWNVYTAVSRDANPTGNSYSRSYLLERLEGPVPIPTSDETRLYLISKLPSRPNSAFYSSQYSSQSVASQQPKVSVTKVDLVFEHEPTSTCYLKVWFKAIYTKTGVGSALIDDYDITYEWKGHGNPCISGTPSPSSIPSPDAKIIIDPLVMLDVPEEEGSITLYVYKYSIIEGYEPDNPTLNQFGALARPTPDIKPNCTPNGS